MLDRGIINMCIDILGRLKSKKPKIEKLSLKQKGGKTIKDKKDKKDYKSFYNRTSIKRKRFDYL